MKVNRIAGEECQNVVRGARRVKDCRLKAGHDREPSRHVPVPQRQLTCFKSFGNAELDRIKVSYEIAKERNLRREDNLVTKPDHHSQKDGDGNNVFVQ